MIITIIAIISVLIALAVLVYDMCEGYQNASGFYRGKEGE